MGRFSTLEEAREYFSCDKFATENGMTLDEIDEAHAVTSMTLGERHKNAFGGVMGGAIFTPGQGRAADGHGTLQEGRPQLVRRERRRG